MRLREWLKSMFIKYFNVSEMVVDLMELADKDKLVDYIHFKFNNKFSYQELYNIFKSELNKKELKSFLEELGHDYIDLDSFDEDDEIPLF